MNFALPLVVSDKVGCASDLVRPGWNGIRRSPPDVEALAEAIGTLVAEPEKRTRYGQRGRELVDAVQHRAVRGRGSWTPASARVSRRLR